MEVEVRYHIVPDEAAAARPEDCDRTEMVTPSSVEGVKTAFQASNVFVWDGSLWRKLHAGTLALIQADSCLMVVKGTSTGTSAARALDIVRSPFDDWPINATTTSTHDRPYGSGKLSIKAWEMDSAMRHAVRRRVERELGNKAISHDPRVKREGDKILTSENEANVQFKESVGNVIEEVFRCVGKRVYFHINPQAEVTTGLPDFSVTQGRVEVMGGEGKTPAVMRSAVNLTGGQLEGDLGKAVRQICSYLRGKGWRYGFLTYLKGTFFIQRLARDTYAFTVALLPSDTNPSVAEMLFYTILESLDKPWVEPSHVEVDIQEVEQQQVQQQQQNGLRRSPRTLNQASATAASCSNGATGNPGAGRYKSHPPAALTLTQECLGSGQHGVVRLGSFYGIPAAVKFADTSKQPVLVQRLENEADFYGRLFKLQGKCIPILHGCGFWDGDTLFFVATSVVKGVHASSCSARSALASAQKAMHEIHQQGVAHGDVRSENIMVESSGNSYQVWFLDFGHSYANPTPAECNQEMLDLRAAFPSSDHSDDTMLEL